MIFTKLFGFAGTDPSFPLLAFLFLVALGVDYNIFLMARVREETPRHGTREGMLRGLAVTGGVITSAGIVLAGTFLVLGVLPLVALTEIGFVVALGVLLDTTLVRSVLVPALVLDLGARIWWPSHPSTNPDPRAASSPLGLPRARRQGRHSRAARARRRGAAIVHGGHSSGHSPPSIALPEPNLCRLQTRQAV